MSPEERDAQDTWGICAGFAAVFLQLLAGVILTQPGCGFGNVRPPQDICSAQHSWGTYHLANGDTSPVVVNNSSYTPDLASWNELQTPITLRESGKGFQIVVEEGGDADSGWLGLASIRASSSGHITRATVTMNTTLLAQYGSRVSDHVLCQELGHLLGLDHHVDLQSCMDDCTKASNWLGCLDSEAATTPSAHDGEQLREIYAHVGGTEQGPACTGAIVVHQFPDRGHGH